MERHVKNNQQQFKMAEIKVIYQPAFKASERPLVNSSREAVRIFKESWDMNTYYLKEEFKLLLMNRACRVLGLVNLSVGSIAGTVADPKMIFSIALKACASSMILCHNHPSGNLNPSREDVLMTRRVSEAGRLLNITVSDHVILADDGYYSFADEGMM